jgi:hypothetical protein
MLAGAFYWMGRRSAQWISRQWLPVGVGAGVVLALPGVLAAAYYFHWYDDWAGFIEFRSAAGSEFLGAGAGWLAGLIDSPVRKRTGASAWAIPVFAFLGISLPFLKPMLVPLDRSALGDRWEGDTCLQSTASTCGPASAATVLRQLGCHATESQLAVAAHTSSSGTEVWYLIRALRPLGFAGKVRCAVLGLDTVRTPAIAGVRNKATGTGHFVAVTQVRDRRWFIADPLTGGGWYTHEEAVRTFDFTGFQLEVTRRTE